MPRTSRGELRHAALLEAAEAVFLEHGYEGASIEEIVRRVGGSKASLYSYFGSKENLFWEVLNQLSDRFMTELAVPTQADADIEGTLAAIGRRFLTIFLDPARCRLFRTMIAESVRFPELSRAFFERGARARQVLAAYLQRQVEAGRIDCSDPEMAASQFLELVKGPPHSRVLLSMPPFTPGFDPDAHVAGAVRLFLYGCSKNRPPVQEPVMNDRTVQASTPRK
ncbi:MAG TPA: TetR/AcrR family transcriptional regulator [Nevskia sp.]|nr:TetR/AcrR family transcriptional regulator [Nevskia sp.]